MNKLAYLFTLIALAGSLFTKAQAPKPVLRIGLIADIQYANADTRGSRFYRNSLNKLRTCVEDFNQQKVQFSLNLGDIIDRDAKDLDSVLLILDKLKKAGLYHYRKS